MKYSPKSAPSKLPSQIVLISLEEIHSLHCRQSESSSSSRFFVFILLASQFDMFIIFHILYQILNKKFLISFAEKITY